MNKHLHPLLNELLTIRLINELHKQAINNNKAT